MDYAAIIWFLPVFYISLYKICITYLLNMGFDFFIFFSLSVDVPLSLPIEKTNDCFLF
jgi:hypothetical protein